MIYVEKIKNFLKIKMVVKIGNFILEKIKNLA